MTLIFEIFDLIGSIFYASSRADRPPLLAEKNQFVSITFRYLLGPKVGLIFHQNVLFNSF